MQNENVVKTYGYYYPVEKELQLVNLINSGNKEKAKLLIDEIIDVNSVNYNLNKNTIETIAIDVGYFSLRTFARVFKNNEGITPAEYRKNLIKR